MNTGEESIPVELNPPPYRELTIASAVFGVLLGALLTSAFTYVALKLGFTLSGSTVAAILGFAVLRGVMGKGSIVENNINQTVASGINNASPGVAFTLPALFLLGQPFDALSVILAAIADRSGNKRSSAAQAMIGGTTSLSQRNCRGQPACSGRASKPSHRVLP